MDKGSNVRELSIGNTEAVENSWGFKVEGVISSTKCSREFE